MLTLWIKRTSATFAGKKCNGGLKARTGVAGSQKTEQLLVGKKGGSWKGTMGTDLSIHPPLTCSLARLSPSGCCLFPFFLPPCLSF